MRMALRPSTNARPRPAPQGGDLEGGVGELRSDCGRGGDPSGEGGGPMWGCGARTAGGGNSAAMGRAPSQRRSHRHLRTTAWVLGPACCQRRRRVGRARLGSFREPACSAAKGESRWRPSFTGGVGAAWIPGGNGLRQQPQPDLVRFLCAAGERVKSVSVFGKRRLCRAGARNRPWRSCIGPRP